MVEVRRAVGVILHRPCVGNYIRLAAHDVSTRCLPHNLDILAVVGQTGGDICAIVGLRRICRFRIQRSVCVEVAYVIRRRRRTIHERRQERKCPPLIDAPLRPGRTGVVDAPPCVGSGNIGRITCSWSTFPQSCCFRSIIDDISTCYIRNGRIIGEVAFRIGVFDRCTRCRHNSVNKKSSGCSRTIGEFTVCIRYYCTACGLSHETAACRNSHLRICTVNSSVCRISYKPAMPIIISRYCRIPHIYIGQFCPIVGYSCKPSSIF